MRALRLVLAMWWVGCTSGIEGPTRPGRAQGRSGNQRDLGDSRVRIARNKLRARRREGDVGERAQLCLQWCAWPEWERRRVGDDESRASGWELHAWGCEAHVGERGHVRMQRFTRSGRYERDASARSHHRLCWPDSSCRMAPLRRLAVSHDDSSPRCRHIRTR